MQQGWKDYDRAADKGPLSFAIKVTVGVFILAAAIGGLGYVFGFFGEGARVVQEELGPAAMLKKYSWFKDASAQLDKKQADIGVYETRMKSMEEGYKDLPRSQWPREDREQYNIWTSEVAGVAASYNALAAEYNANMSKVNWRFANKGDLPAGAEDPLPREFKSYQSR